MITAIIWDIDPQVFHNFPLLRWYGICWLLGMVLGYRIIQHIYKKEGIPVSELDKLTLYVVIAAVLGARLGHVFFYDWAYYSQHPIEILPIKLDPHFQFTGFSGLASHGGIIGVLIALYFYQRKHQKDYLWLIDRLMVAGTMLACFIRLGNLMNSEIIGLPSDLPWAFVFTRVDLVPRHPAQLYEALFYLAVFFVVYGVWRSGRFQHYRGYLFGLGLALIFLQRFLVEFLKENQVAFEDGLTLNMGQILSIPLVLIGIGIMVWARRRPTQPTVELAE